MILSLFRFAIFRDNSSERAVKWEITHALLWYSKATAMASDFEKALTIRRVDELPLIKK